MIEFNTHTYPLRLPEMLSDNATEELEKALALYTGYKEVIVLNSVGTAFYISLSSFERGTGVLSSPNEKKAGRNWLSIRLTP
jgi:dTDP-4-amino-4,6-dideoxygalactose transaminase